ncbi:MarR family winged helix-turn-helix transcriptional regulator, partial [Streptomyces tendae]
MAAVDLTTHPGHLARRLQQAHYLLWNTMVSEETTSPQYAVLNALVAEPGLDQRTVGERVGLDRSTIAEVVSRLGRRELLDKVRDPQDGRRSLLRLTDEGLRVHRRLGVRVARMNQVYDVLGVVGHGEVLSLHEGLGRSRGTLHTVDEY